MNQIQVTRQDLIDVLSLSEGRISQLEKEGILEKIGRNKFDLTDCIKKYILFLRKTNRGTTTLSFQEERQRLVKVQADIQELVKAEKEGLLISRDQIEKDAFDTGRTIREALFNIPERISPVLAAEEDAKKIHQILVKEITQSLESLSKQ